MPWKECGVMDEKLKFVARLIEGETSSISKPTETLQLNCGGSFYRKTKKPELFGPGFSHFIRDSVPLRFFFGRNRQIK
jgi:hypothetical protein